ncbi:cyclic pyranopterin monophosphate synthase MoaC [Planctomycetes bacterium Poly30]
MSSAKDLEDVPVDPCDSGDGAAEESLSHVRVDGEGRSHSVMVDVGGKPVTGRTAQARALVDFPPGLLAGILESGGPKGPIEEVARVAGILAAKRTGDLIPMCHPVGLDVVEIDFARIGPDRLEIRCKTACSGRTGVEMEAMTGASIAALTVYDMTKALAKGIRVVAVELLEKTGGKHGSWSRE